MKKILLTLLSTLFILFYFGAQAGASGNELQESPSDPNTQTELDTSKDEEDIKQELSEVGNPEKNKSDYMDKGNSNSKTNPEKNQDIKKNQSAKESDNDFHLHSEVPLKKGDAGDNVKRLQEQLNKLGFIVEVTSSFEKSTIRQVKAFQEYYELNVDGVVGPSTSSKIKEVLNSPLQKGKTSDNIIPFKEKLNRMGYDGIAISTVFGSHTEQRVKEFQSDHELPVSGILDENTQVSIQKAFEKNTKEEIDTQNSIQKSSDNVFTKGDRHPKITELKRNLNHLGFDGLAIADLYGSFTTKRVKEFQTYYGLKATGNAGPDTFKKVEEVLSSPLQKGKNNSDLIPFKDKLNRMGYDGIAISNVFGPHTERRVEQFQSDQGLPVSGILEENTQAKINSVFSEIFSKGGRHQSVTELKRNLNHLGFDGLAIADLYGSFTTKRVKEFQTYYNLDATGNADLNTLRKVDQILSSPLQKGKNDSNVIPFKKKLNEMGYDGIAISNVFGPHTERRVKQFQSDHGLPVSGILEMNTQTKINNISKGIFSKGDRHPKITELKRNLNQLGFDGLAIADLYGSFTTKRVKEFQAFYGLKATGDAGPDTFKKVDEILSSPLQKGKNNADVIPFKEKLNQMGYNGIAISNVFGPHTERRVKQFQSDNGLPVSGILEDKTQAKIHNVFDEIFSKGGRHPSVTELKRNLNRLGFDGLAIADLYGSFTSKRVKEFQSYYGLKSTGRANLNTLKKVDEILSSPFQKGNSNKKTLELKKNLNTLGYNGLAESPVFGSFTQKRVKQFQADYNLPVSGIAEEVTLAKLDEVLKGTDYTNYDITLDKAVNMQMNVRPQTDKNQAWVSKSYVNNGKVTTSVLNVRIGPGTGNAIVGQVTKGQSVDVVGEHNGWYAIKFNNNQQWAHASPDQVKHYLNPANFVDDIKQKYQFLDLSRVSSASKAVLNNHLKGKGTLAGEGQAFIDAGQRHGVNDVYLISHATLETGHGSSRLAQGVKVGKTKSGELKLVTPNNRSKLKNIKKVYNMFGVHAFDNCALECGAKKAYKESWTSPYKAIVGGSAFIGNNYIKKGQNTLYSMRWNPAAMENGAPAHQYATDIGWASKQIHTMYNLYETMKIGALHLDIPQYK